MYRQLMHFPKETKVAIYNRVSTEKRAQVEAIEHQVEESKTIVLQEGLCLVRQYVEMETATSAERRIQYRQMIEDLENDVFDLLVVKSQDRIMRDQAEWHLLKRTLHKHRKNLYFYMEDEVFNQRENGLKHDVQAMLDECGIVLEKELLSPCWMSMNRNGNRRRPFTVIGEDRCVMRGRHA